MTYIEKPFPDKVVISNPDTSSFMDKRRFYDVIYKVPNAENETKQVSLTKIERKYLLNIPNVIKVVYNDNNTEG